MTLTFDDGPGKYTNDILRSLNKENMNAYFFWQTSRLYASRPWENLYKEGHGLGSHGHRHVDFTRLSPEKQWKHLQVSVREMTQITGISPEFFRPPYGKYNKDTVDAASSLGMKTVLWSLASLDWELKQSPESIIRNITEHLNPGAVILLHEFRQTRDILPELLQEIRNRNYKTALL
nr:polysaccharide deacetylase family protein [Alkalicoccus halolimnae]